jgi:hypothetical protein
VSGLTDGKDCPVGGINRVTCQRILGAWRSCLP